LKASFRIRSCWVGDEFSKQRRLFQYRNLQEKDQGPKVFKAVLDGSARKAPAMLCRKTGDGFELVRGGISNIVRWKVG
jgi:hypothetical protein